MYVNKPVMQESKSIQMQFLLAFVGRAPHKNSEIKVSYDVVTIQLRLRAQYMSTVIDMNIDRSMSRKARVVCSNDMF